MRQVEVPSSERFDEAVLPLAAIVDSFLATGRANISAWVGTYEDDGREPTFHLSGAGCLRRDVLKKERAPETPIQGISLRRFAVGNMVEALLDKAVESKGMSVAKQTKVWMDWAFRAGRGHKWTIVEGDPGHRRKLDLTDCLAVGKLDHIVEWQGRRFLLDWKSCHAGKFYWLDRSVDEGYMLQLAGYLDLYERQYGEHIDEARLVFAEKDTLRLKQVCVPREPWVAKARARWQAQRGAWEERVAKGVLPAELPFRGQNGTSTPAWSCDPRYCGFAMAKRGDGTPVCPAVTAFWERNPNGLPKPVKKNGNGSNGELKPADHPELEKIPA